MKNLIKCLFFVVTFLCATIVMAQSSVSGTIIDSETNEPMPGVNVVEKGTTNGVSTDFDGNFSLTPKSSNAVIALSYVGYTTKEVTITGDSNLGNIKLEPSQFGLDEVNIVAFSLAIDRKTPVAVSTIRANEISLKLGTQEFPEILKSTPGVYATKAGGGYGDGRINLRGFDSQNVAVMINGVPINDMENGRVFWSNWAGLGDVTSSMQVQRGLGAAKVAVPSVGGTINIITRTTDAEMGGNVYTTLGNDGYEKFGFMYSTGLMENGFAATVSAALTEGDGYVDGTPFRGVNYFLNVSKQLNEDHKLSFTAFGAKQQHGQRQNSHLIETYRASERGRKFNSDWGYKQGQLTNSEDNFYHKPQISLNHYWTVSDRTNVSTAAYVSFGTGGGGGFSGVNKFGFANDDYRIGNFGTIDFDKIVAENEALGVEGSESILRASRNDHKWFGVLSTLDTKLTDKLTLLTGLDYRYYRGIHFTEVTDLLGGQYFLDNRDINNPNNQAKVGDKILFDNDGIVGWLGGFGQLEYSNDALSAFVSFSASNTSYKRVDRFLYLDSDPLQETDNFNFFGFGAKGGANYNLNENHNVFVNLGYFERAPFFRSVFANRNNVDVNEDAENQKITSFEAGYGYRNGKFRANLNAYYTIWQDRTEFASFQAQDGTRNFANILGVNAVHKGLEIDATFRATDQLKFTGMASIGDWRWQNNVENVQIIDENNDVVSTVNLFIADLKVGDAAQTTMALGANYKLTPETTFTVDYNYFDNLYARFDPSDRGEIAPDAWKVPAYGIFDSALRHNLKFGSFDATLTGRINNVLDTEYIADARDGAGSVAQTALVYYGFGRTFSVGAKLKF